MMDGVATKVDRLGTPGITVTKATGYIRNNNNHRQVRVLSGYVGSAHYGVHDQSLANLVRGVAERVLFTPGPSGVLESTRKPLDGVFKRLAPEKRALVSNTRPTSVVAVEDFPSLYHDARKRAIYTRAVTSLSHETISRRDSVVSTFVKAEKVNFSAKADPAPRVIQPRSARYNVCVGRYLKPLEKALLSSYKASHGYCVVVKGLNAQGVALTLRSNWDEFDSPVAVPLDASRFDQHVSLEALKWEHSVYNSIFNSSELKELLSWQLENKGVGYADGWRVKYSVRGCRMSGDMNTSMGNCIIMSSIVLAYLRVNQINARLTNNGDDCVLILERRDLHKLDGIDKWFTDFGFKLTREPFVDVFERIEFCQTQPVLCEDGWRMVRNPYTATSKDAVSLLSWATELEYDRWRGAISSCGLALTRGVPFWEAYYRRLGGVQHAGALAAISDSGMGYLSRNMQGKARITEASRYSFWLAFGMLPDEQIAMEELDVDVSYTEPTPMTFGAVEPLCKLLSKDDKAQQ